MKRSKEKKLWDARIKMLLLKRCILNEPNQCYVAGFADGLRFCAEAIDDIIQGKRLVIKKV